MASIADTGDQVPPAPPEDEVVVVRRRSPWWRLAKWLSIILAILVAAIIAFFIWINSDSGRQFIVDRINKLEFASGLKVKVDRIDGSIWDEMTVHGLTLSDPQGEFFAANQAQVQYDPFAYFRRSHIDIQSLTIPEARLRRLPQLRTVDPNAPLIPNILLDIGALRIDRLILERPVTGREHHLSINGDVHLQNSAARSNLQVVALQGPGIAGGDRINVRLDAAPEENRLGIEMKVDAPANGFVASMTGIEKPMQIGIGGRGTWANWQGRLLAAMEGKRFAELNIQAQNGTFRFTGPARPDLFVTGPAQRLTEPLTQVDLTTSWANRRADIDLMLTSRSAAVVADGIIDFAQNRYEGLSIGARLLRPGAIAPNLSGRDVRLAMVLDGPMSTPRVAYDLQAAALGISTRTLENFRARGAARVDADRIVVPVQATATRITGLPDALGGLLTNVRMDGDILVEGSNILSDNLRLRSDRVDAVLALAFDVGRGRYNVGIQGRLNNYLISSVGIVDITSDVDVVTQGNGFGISGRVAVQTRRIFNQSAVDILGGNASATANINVGPDGIVRIANIRLSAPKLDVTEGAGTYYPDGRLALQLRGRSDDYGIVSVRVTGTLAAPNIELQVNRFAGYGLTIDNLTARVRAIAGGYAIEARGSSNYGPFEADVLLTGGGSRIQVNRLLLAGLTFRGALSRQGTVFAGALDVEGRGIDGNIQLAAAGPRQRVIINATARNASIPGAGDTVAGTIQEALLRLDAILPIAGDPFELYAADGDLQVAGLRMGTLWVERGRTELDYAGLQGALRFLAVGSNQVPFDIAGNAELTPDLIRAVVQGNANNIPFRFAEPAEILRVARGSNQQVRLVGSGRGATDWLLRPVRVVFREGQGNLRLAGRFGDGLIVQSRLDNFDLAIVNTVRAGLGIGGQATGSVDFFLPPGGAFPRAEARLNIQNFTRSGIVARSVPVNIAMAGALRPEGGELNAVVRQNDALVGRLQARLQPLPPGSGNWNQRLMAAPLTGGIRYNGPASILLSVVNIPGHHLEGPVAIGADFTGRVNNPQFVGVVRSNSLIYTNEQYGTRITNIALDGRFDGSELNIVSMTGRAGDGTVTVNNGRIGLASAAGYPLELTLNLDNARLARSDDLSASATGNLTLLRNAQIRRISGTLALGEVRYQIVRQGAAQVTELAGVRRKERAPDPSQPQPVRRAAADNRPWDLDLTIEADNRIFVSGMGLESEWAANIRVTGTTASPIIAGGLDLQRGTLSFAGRRFVLNDDTSRIDFTRAGIADPELNIEASADIEDVEVTLLLEGSSQRPRPRFTSTPGLPEDEILSRILFGSSVTEISAIQAVQLAASLNTLRGSRGGLDPLGTLRAATGIDRLRILGEDDTVGRGTAIAAGFYLSDDIYLEIITDARGFTATQLEIALTRSLSLLSQFGTTSGTNVNLRYSRDY